MGRGNIGVIEIDEEQLSRHLQGWMGKDVFKVCFDVKSAFYTIVVGSELNCRT